MGCGEYRGFLKGEVGEDAEYIELCMVCGVYRL